MIRRRLLGLAATLGLIALLAGLPWLLLQVGFGTLPTLTSWTDLASLLLRRDDGSLALMVIKAIGWITWTLLAGLILLEMAASLRGVRAPDLRGLALPQSVARHLVATAAALFVALPAHPLPAHAEPTPAPPAVAAVTVEKTDVTPATPTAEETPSVHRHTVKRGESLWSIAEQHLGDGHRYTEIAALNTRLLDGRGDGFLAPGWTLNLPDDEQPAAASGASTSAATTYTVRKGDTLSEIALDHYGDARTYPRIADASRPITQPGGRHLTDPDVIDIGWTLSIPTDAGHTRPNAADAGARPSSEHAPAASTPVRASSGPAMSTPAPEHATRETAEPVAEPEADQTGSTAAGPAVGHEVDGLEAPMPGWLVGGLVGGGGLLAGSLWLALLRLRAAQFRSRRRGRMIAIPPPGLVPVEKTLATAGAAAWPSVDFVDQALRRLAAHQGRARNPMPLLAAVELSRAHLRLHLSEAATLADPWKQAPDSLHWELPADVDLDAVGPLDPAVQAPYPHLTTVGDNEHQRWLLNLEDVGVIRLTGDPDYVRDYARYLATEMAVHPWTVDVRVDLVGIAHEAVALNPRRVEHHAKVDAGDIAARVLAHAVGMIDRTAEADLDSATARATLLDDDLWPSRALMVGGRPDAGPVRQLGTLIASHPARAGTVLILLVNVTDESDPIEGEEIQLTPTGRVLIPSVGLDLVAVGLTSEEAAGCADLFAQADSRIDQPVPHHREAIEGWQTHANQAGQLLPERTLPRDEHPGSAGRISSLLPEPDEVYLNAAATTVEDLAALAPAVPERVRQQVEEDDPTLDDDLRTWHDPDRDLPTLSLLGPVTVRVAAGGQAGAAVDRKPFHTEIVAFLATRPHGATTEEIAAAMRFQPVRVRKDLTAVRAWLGVNPRSGRLHVPDSRQTAAAKTRGRAVYQIEGLLVDADLFRRLRVRGEARGPEGLDDLRHALGLVTGTPFDQLRGRGGAWLTEGDRLDQILLCAIVDVAHVLTTAALQRGDHSEAQQTAELAVRVAPQEDAPRLDLAAVFEAKGHHHAAEQLLRDDVCDRSDDEYDTPTELPPRSEQIIHQRQWLTRRPARTSA